MQISNLNTWVLSQSPSN